MVSSSSVKGTRKYLYVPTDRRAESPEQKSQHELPKDVLDKLLHGIGREAVKEKTPSLQELEQSLQGLLSESMQRSKAESTQDSEPKQDRGNDEGLPLVRKLIQKGYLKDSPKWLSSKGFTAVGGHILSDVMKALKTGESGLHETQNLGMGSVVTDTTRRYEPGDDVRLLNVPKSLLNTIQRTLKEGGKVGLPLRLSVEDFEEYETTQDVRVAVVYCIDLSSTMRYSSM
jgi:uncharacterized protein with von Willebrand factor type A (vWA) domain